MTTSINSYKLNDLIKYAVIKLASIGVEDIYELLTIDEQNDGYDVIDQILSDSIDRLEYYEPLVLKMFVEFDNKPYEFIDNFSEHLSGIVPRTGLQLIPRKIVSINDLYSGSKRGIIYEPPVLLSSLSGRFPINAIVNRPVVKAKSEKQYSDDSRIYYLGELYKPQLFRFKNLFVVNLCNHIIRLNENLEHPNMPINTFVGLQNFYSDLKTTVDSDYENSHGYAGIYQ